MLHRPIARALFAGAALLSLMTVPGPAPADTFFETVYLPTNSVVSVPGPSVLATSYSGTYLPTSTLVPTSLSSTFLPTSTVYSSDSVLLPTSTTYYRRSLLRRRRFVERTSYSSYLPTTSLLPTSYLSTSAILPTSYLLPTTYFSTSVIAPTSYVIDNGVVTTSASYPCDTTSSAPPPRSTANRSSAGNSGGTIVSEPTNGSSGERKPSATVNSTPSGDDGIPSTVSPVPAPATTTPPVPRPPDAQPTSPLTEPGVVDPDKIPRTTPGSGGNPTDRLQIPPPGSRGTQSPNETTLRTVRRPSYDVRNILRGRVISAESKQPEEGVTVIVSSLTRNFADRPAMTDADGEFKVSLPDGDWTVKVKMPSGSIFTVGQNYVTASNGKVIDASGRPVAEFLITR